MPQCGFPSMKTNAAGCFPRKYARVAALSSRFEPRKASRGFLNKASRGSRDLYPARR